MHLWSLAEAGEGKYKKQFRCLSENRRTMVTKCNNILVIIALIAALPSMFGAFAGGYIVYTVSQRNNSSVTIPETAVPVPQIQIKSKLRLNPLPLLATQIL